MKIKKQNTYLVLGILFSMEYYWQPFEELYDFLKLGFGISLVFLGMFFLWQQGRKNKLGIILSLFFLVGLVVAQSYSWKRNLEIKRSSYSNYLRIDSCYEAHKMATRDINDGTIKYFYFGDDTTVYKLFQSEEVTIIDVSNFSSENLKCYNQLVEKTLLGAKKYRFL